MAGKETVVKEYDLPSDSVSEFADLIKEIHGVDINLCYQCHKCTSGCPLSYLMELTPAQVIHGIRLGLKDLVLNSNTFWLCVACSACTTRCPQETGLLRVMDALTAVAMSEGIRPKVPTIADFYNIGVAEIGLFGRMYDLGVAGLVKLRAGNLTQDLGMGLRMLTKGKMELLPRFQNSRAAHRIFKRVRDRERQL